jgi:phosphoglycolate phosphatase-like HAD superfamily hydrolase
VKLLSLDFDGVIADSAREAFVVATRTWRALRPASPLRDAEAEPLYRAFVALMPLGNRAEDYAVALAAIEAGVALPDQAAYDAFHAAQDARFLRAFHERFYAERGALSEEDPHGWRAMLGPYPELIAVLRRRAGGCRYAIATAKDRRSVGLLLADYGVADLFEPALVLDKETGVTKAAHHEHLARITGLSYEEMTFVDDKVSHLEAVGALGVRCALAAWGYNGPREARLARAGGHLVCTLADVEAQLFPPLVHEIDTQGAAPSCVVKLPGDVDERG